MPHIHRWINERPDVDWLEIHSCNFITSSPNLALLRQLKDHYPLSFHGVSLNLGGTEDIDLSYLGKLKRAVDEFNPALISDHACFTAMDGVHYHDLLPVPYTMKAVEHIAERIAKVQDFLGRKILLENVSRYYNYPNSDLTEAEFLNAIAEHSSCGLLLDLNNAFVNEINHQESATELLHVIDFEKVKEIHLGGFHREGNLLIDSHSTPVSDEVWALLRNCLAQLAPYSPPLLIEWDNQLPELNDLLVEQQKAKKIQARFKNVDQRILA